MAEIDVHASATHALRAAAVAEVFDGPPVVDSLKDLAALIAGDSAPSTPELRAAIGAMLRARYGLVDP